MSHFALPDPIRFDLNLVPNVRAKKYPNRFMIDTSVMPGCPGVYVIRYRDLLIPRQNGASPVIRIGCSDKGLRSRFDEYNHAKIVTDPGWDRQMILRKHSKN